MWRVSHPARMLLFRRAAGSSACIPWGSGGESPGRASRGQGLAPGLCFRLEPAVFVLNTVSVVQVKTERRAHKEVTWPLLLRAMHIYTKIDTNREKATAAHSSVLPWRIPGTGEPGGLPSMGPHRVEHG